MRLFLSSQRELRAECRASLAHLVGMEPRSFSDLPADVVGHIVVRMTTAHHIGRAAPTCKVVSVTTQAR